MYDFSYYRPDNLAGALRALQADDDAKPLGGGQTLLPTMKMRLAQPSELIDLGDVPELKGIRVDGGRLIVGAGEKHADVASSAIVTQAIPALARLAAGIGDPHVRHMGTLGGSIANNDPAADYPAAVVGLGATIITTHREISGDDFFTGMFATALEQGELVKAVAFPIPERAGYAKLPNPASRYAIVGVFVAKNAAGVRVAVTGAGPCVFRAPALETALASSFEAAAVDGIAISGANLNTDLHASADYRAHMVSVMAKRAVSQAIG